MQKIELPGSIRLPFVSLAGDRETKSRCSPVCALAHAQAPGLCDHDLNLPAAPEKDSHPSGVAVFFWSCGRIQTADLILTPDILIIAPCSILLQLDFKKHGIFNTFRASLLVHLLLLIKKLQKHGSWNFFFPVPLDVPHDGCNEHLA